MCLVVASLLLLSVSIFSAQLRVLPWFIGFALIAAGLSGICPMVLALRRLGFR